MKGLKVPQIDSIEELARFWDTHDLTEFEEDLEEVTEPVFERKPGTVIPLHLQPQELEAVKRVAHWVAPSNNDHGVHAALKRFGLC